MQSAIQYQPMHPTTLHFLLPFALSALDSCLTDKAMLAQSAYAKLLRRASLIERYNGAAFQRALPHESWLARRFQIAPRQTEIEQTPFAPYMLLAEGGAPGTALWTCVQPIHLQLAHDHLVLANPAVLNLTEDEALSLLEAARPTFAEFDLSLAAPTPYRWYLSGEALGVWLSAAPLRASGRNIEIWLPSEKTPANEAKPCTRAWLKLQNEVQMVWFDHPVNRAREAQGKPSVNSIWLYAQGTLEPVARPFTHIFSNAQATRGLGLAAQAQVANKPANFDELAQALKDPIARSSTLIELDNLTQPCIEQDSFAQREALLSLERDWFAPALQALKNGTLPSLALTLCGENDHITLQVTRADLRKFWRQRSLASLLDSGTSA